MENTIFIDIETFSSVDITSCGAYKYIESPDFEILLISYAIGEGEVKVIDLASGDAMTEEFINALRDPNYLKVAHNAVFERLSFRRVGFDVPSEQWYCTSVKAAYCGLPLSLDGVSKALDLQDKKLDTGKALIRYFSCPCKATKINGGRTRNYPWHSPEKWELYKTYNVYDVKAEREIYNTLSKYDIPDTERRLYVLDQKINDRGIKVDEELAKAAICIDEEYTGLLTKRAKEITGLSNPNSVSQIKSWIRKKTGKTIDSFNKAVMPDVIQMCKDNKEVSEMLDLRQRLSKTSIKKYYAMVNCAGSDGRVRGTFQFYGANRTGRWAGRLLQLQNLSKNHLSDIETARNFTRKKDWQTLEMLYDDVPDVLSQLVRTALIAPKGKIFSVADFSAIEARVISWLANEEWRMEVFRGDGKIYEATGARMFGVPISSITKGSALRDKSKISELALGFGGSVGALAMMGGERMGLSAAEMASLVKKWRMANPNIVQMWSDFETCAIDAIKYRRTIVSDYRGVMFQYDGFYLIVMLPSGRQLFYMKPRIGTSRIGTTCIYYRGTIQATKQWGEVDTYGGKLTENIVQATARDLMGHAMLLLDSEGYDIVMHVHDEVIAEVPLEQGAEKLKRMERLMSIQPTWAMDLPLNADGYLTTFYKKD